MSTTKTFLLRFSFFFDVSVFVFQRLFFQLLGLTFDFRSEVLRGVFVDFHPLLILFGLCLRATFDVVIASLFALHSFLFASFFEQRDRLLVADLHLIMQHTAVDLFHLDISCSNHLSFVRIFGGIELNERQVCSIEKTNTTNHLL